MRHETLTVAGAAQVIWPRETSTPVSRLTLPWEHDKGTEQRSQLTTFTARDELRKHSQSRALFLDAAAFLKDSYSVETEFNSLEAKVAQIVMLCERLRAENIDLRQQLTTAQSDARRLTERIEGARTRIEELVARLPD